jgi:uncharacterized HAD superfamily protein
MRIGVDLDGVFADFNDRFGQYYNEINGTNLDFNKKERPYSYIDFLGISREESFDIVDGFINSPAYEEIQPVAGAVSGIKELKEFHKLWIVTSRSPDVEKQTVDFIEKYASGCFEGVVHTGQFSRDGKHKVTKGEVCKEYKLDIFIDDYIEYIEEITRFGVSTIFFAKFRSEDIPENNLINVAKSWEEIIQIIGQLDE